jgi:hypothetical protein
VVVFAVLTVLKQLTGVETVVRSAEADWGVCPVWDPLSSLEPLFVWLIEQGDVQTAFHLASVIGLARLSRTQWCSASTVKRWCVHYLDLLNQMQLWTIRNQILRAVEWDDVRTLTTVRTTFYVNCPTCRKALSPNSWHCSACRKIVANCCLCHQPVRGLLSWCQVCGHGGHALEMRAWWKTKAGQRRVCPEPTCTHVCATHSMTK